MKVKYIGRHIEVINKYGKFKNNVFVDVDNKIAIELAKSKSEFVIENDQPIGNIKKKEK